MSGTTTALITLKNRLNICNNKNNELHEMAADTVNASLSHKIILRELAIMAEAEYSDTIGLETQYTENMNINDVHAQWLCDDAMHKASQAVKMLSSLMIAANAVNATR